MAQKPRPPQVQRAVVTGDIEALREYASAGGRASAAKRRLERDNRDAEDAHHLERQQAQKWERLCSTNEHEHPID